MRTRRETSPDVTMRKGSTVGPISVDLSPNQEVRWTYGPDGESVIGYTITTKRRKRP